MRKAVLHTAVVMLSLCCSCSDSDAPDMPGNRNRPIYFDNPVEEGTPLAEITQNNLDAISVYGTCEGSGTLLFDNTPVRITDGKWSYEDTKYWEPDKRYHFFAIAPERNKGWRTTLSDIASDNPGCVIDMNVMESGGKTDLVAARTGVIATPPVLTAMHPVSFDLEHMLSRVSFNFYNDLANPFYEIHVIYIMVVDYITSGRIDISDPAARWDTDSSPYGVWLGVDGTLVYTYAPSGTEPLFLIPGKREKTDITVAVQLYYNENGDPNMSKRFSHEYTHNITLPPLELKKGHSYTLTAHIAPENILGDRPLNPITFRVEEEWRWDSNLFR